MKPLPHVLQPAQEDWKELIIREQEYIEDITLDPPRELEGKQELQSLYHRTQTRWLLDT